MTSNQIMSGLKNGSLNFDEICEEFIKINAKRKELEGIEKSLKDSILNGVDSGTTGIVYQNDSDSVVLEVSDIKEQNVKAIKKDFDELDKGFFDAGITISKSKVKEYVETTYAKELVKDTIKKVNAIIDLNSDKIGEQTRVVVRPVKE